MSIKKEVKMETKITCKGILKGIDDEGLHIEDEKTGVVEVLGFDSLKAFTEKNISITVTDSQKTEVEENA